MVITSPRSVPATVLPSEGLESIRYAENLKAYPVGRYVDPNNPLVMHERHTVYRVETTAKWNLHPNPSLPAPMGPVQQIVDPARRESPVNAEVIAEVQRQKAVSHALIQQNQRLEQSLSHLSGVLSASQQLAQQNAQLKQELSLTEKRLNALERAVREAPPAPNPALQAGDDSW